MSVDENSSIIEQLDLVLAEKTSEMRKLVERHALSLNRDLDLEMLKLAPWLKKMTMRDFCIKYGGDIAEAERQHAKSKLENDPLLVPPVAPPKAAGGKAVAGKGTKRTGTEANMPGSASSSNASATPGGNRSTRPRRGDETPRGGSSRSMATPAGGRSVPVAFTPKQTPARQMQAGEGQFSKNGSPLVVVPNTAKAKVGGKKNGAALGDPSVLLTLGDGTEITIDNATDLEGLQADDKKLAVAHLEELAQKVQAHLEWLQKA